MEDQLKKQRVISSTVITFDGIKIKVIKKTSMKNLYLRVKQGSGEIVLTATVNGLKKAEIKIPSTK